MCIRDRSCRVSFKICFGVFPDVINSPTPTFNPCIESIPLIAFAIVVPDASASPIVDVYKRQIFEHFLSFLQNHLHYFAFFFPDRQNRFANSLHMVIILGRNLFSRNEIISQAGKELCIH